MLLALVAWARGEKAFFSLTNFLLPGVSEGSLGAVGILILGMVQLCTLAMEGKALTFGSSSARLG